MTGRKLLIAIVAAALYAVVLVATASAQEHQVRVTLVTGQVMVLTVDVPPGGSVASALPALPAPVKSVEDLGAVATPTPVPTVPAPTPTVPSIPTPGGTATPSPSPGQQSGGGGTGGGGSNGSTSPGTTPQGSTTTGGSRRHGGNGSSGTGTVGDVVAGAKHKARKLTKKARRKARTSPNAITRPDGVPTLNNPTVSLASPGPAAIGVPNFFIDKFRIPPFLLPIYQAAGIQYGVRWEVLAAINEIETDYGRNLNVSTAGAVGWMQFLPATWRMYGVDANNDGVKDPNNPADAIFAAARYLRAAGAGQDLRRAIFSYNHAGWYVDSVLLRARLIAGLPSNLVGSLTGLTQGRFPVDARARYADSLSRADLKTRRRANRAVLVESGSHRSIDIFAHKGSPVVAVNDGRIVKTGHNRRLGRFIVLQDVYGNTYTYSHLGRVAKRYPAPKPRRVSQKEIAKELALPKPDARPTAPATDTAKPAAKAPARKTARRASPHGHTQRRAKTAPTKQRLFAHPNRRRSAAAGGAQQEFQRSGRIDGDASVAGYLKRVFGLDRKDVRLRQLRKGAHVVAGTILGRVGKTVKGTAAHVRFEIRPAGRGAPRIDPKPILDGWKLLESTAIYRAAGQNPFVGRGAPSIGQILLMGKDALAQRVLADPRIQIYDCGRRDIQTGQIDRRVLATLEFLAASGFKPTVTALKCGHSLMTVSGNISEHSTGDAVDIAAVNGIPILGHQGAGSITELVIQRLLTLQGTMKPHQIISLMTFPGTDNTLSMPDHANHIHVGFRPMFGTNAKLVRQFDAILRPQQWTRLIDRLGQLDEPTVSRTPSRFATKVKPSPQGKLGD